MSGITSVANTFLDKYMPKANGEFVKVYLYLLRCSSANNTDLSICKIADTFNHTEKDVIRAIKYWEQEGLISVSYAPDKSICSITLCSFNSHSNHKAVPVNSFLTEEVSATEIIPEPAKEPVIKKKRTYTASEVNTFMEQENVAEIMFISEKYLGRTLAKADINTILYLYDDLEFSPELIEYLIEYCVSNNHKAIRYIEKVAIAWAESGITTIEQAKEEASIYSNDYFSVLKAFGISGRNPAKSERDFIKKWTTEYGFSLDIILNACNRTMETIHQPSFQYADSILSKWKKHNIKNISDIKNLDEEHTRSKAVKVRNTNTMPKNSFSNFPQRSYDYTELEKELLANNNGGY